MAKRIRRCRTNQQTHSSNAIHGIAPCNPSPSVFVKHRTSREIRGDFALISVETIPVATALGKFERLWDEANAAASQLALIEDIADYITLLKDMDVWFQQAKNPRL
ncbi:hypothetical protein [Burkholderia sp. Leaf177]|uniref:hypothetical protein n=1 Tax=Burkholderia sp. Leaf177 TaxID=1736287 RepID=UPI0012E3EEF6|nr:hypothetical protein [Burkholderia sp. Leaf177]